MSRIIRRNSGLDIPQELIDKVRENTSMSYPPGMKGIKHQPSLQDLAESTRDDELKEKYNELYNLKFMERMLLNGQYITRVPGGWIFDKVFVPYMDKEEQGLNL